MGFLRAIVDFVVFYMWRKPFNAFASCLLIAAFDNVQPCQTVGMTLSR